ncbi:hypothetical protein S7711_06120 [Stachybotrys chartarum IBT 7711]|uniref:Carrier domain-containing protein n=1 Tax=Stachybotrys chartarum (strain CBS 109288 / IBT 7711) TaxID=1280523 RepID=A0A084B667_STACB|nr:hypothetical protein S7711_06120 [Stachybotrys chartarum IBT 7711]
MATGSVLSLQDVNDGVLIQIAKDCSIAVDDIEDVYACTPFQSGLLTDSDTYVQRFIHSLDTFVDLDRFSAALNEVVDLNHTLRTRVVDCDLGLVQVVVRRAQPLSNYVQRPTNPDIEQYLHHDRCQPMHLATPMARFAIVGRKLITTIHHAISDHYSLKFLIADTWSVYQHQAPSQHAPFKEFVKYCGSLENKTAVMFWKSQFQGGTPEIFPSVPAGHSVKASQSMSRDVILKKKAPAPLMPAYIEAAWSITAADYTDSDSIAFGFVMSGRSPALAGVETTLGPTITTVPMQVNLKPTTTIQQLLKSRNQTRRLLSTSPALQYGLANIRRNVSDEARIASGFQTVLNILHEADTEADTPGMTLEAELDIHRAYGLVLTCTLKETGVLFKVAFDNAVLPEDQMDRVLRQLEHRLKVLIDSPSKTAIGQLQRLNFGDTLELMNWNKHVSETTEKRVHDLFAIQARAIPDDMAVDAWDGKATYRELDCMTNNLAHELLHDCRVSAQEPVAFAMERSLSLVVAVLGIMKAGGICVPIDISLPTCRKENIAQISEARTILMTTFDESISGHTSHVIRLDREARPAVSEVVESSSNHAAYILFTSGSSGQPKGVVLEHRSLSSSFSNFGSQVGWTRGTRVLQFAAPAWDACALEVLGPLIAGGCVCIPSGDEREAGLAEYITANRIDFAIQTPTALRNLRLKDVPTLKSLMSAGEPIPPDAARTWGGKLRLFNGWGPCETSVCAAIAELTPASVYPDTIGRPVGSALWIVNRQDSRQLLPIGAVGEILVEGPGVAREYLKDPTKTRASFISPPPFVPKRGTFDQKLYRTGDLGKFNPDGSITFIGRQDNQVKVRGQRFELAEVEQVLTSHPHVDSAAVAVHQSPSKDHKDLVAVLALSLDSGYSSPNEGAADDLRQVFVNEDNHAQLQAICDFAKAKLPTFMVPTVWLVVVDLPQMTSTKLDRVKIKNWLNGLDLSGARDIMGGRGNQGSSSSSAITPPVNNTEKALHSAWCAVLAIEEEKIGRQSSFVKLGGDSITAMQVATRCRRQGLRISVSILLRAETLADAAIQIEPIKKASSIPSLAPEDEALERSLSPIQKFLVDNGGPAMNNWFNQSFLLEINSSYTMPPSRLQQAFQRLVAQHSMLRARFSHSKDHCGNITLVQKVTSQNATGHWRFRAHLGVDAEECLQEIVDASQASLDIVEGPVFSADLICLRTGKTLLFMAAHHLVIDLVSWRILWEDLENILRDETYTLPPSLPFPLWIQQQADKLSSPAEASPEPNRPTWPKADVDFWKMRDRIPTMGEMRSIQRSLSPEGTQTIMGDSCNAPLNTTPVVLMLTAVIQSFHRVFADRGSPALYVEGHGRDFDINSALDPSRTVGWFTTMMPLAAGGIDAVTSLEEAVIAVKDCYWSASAAATEQFTRRVLELDSFRRNDVEIIFNFAGRLQQVTKQDALFRLWNHPSVKIKAASAEAEHVGLISILVYIDEMDKLVVTLDYNCHMAHQDRIALWACEITKYLEVLLTQLPTKATKLTLSDLPLLKAPNSVSHIHARLAEAGIAQENVESIYPCTALQEGILFAQMKHDWKGDEYRDRFAFQLASQVSREVDAARVVGAWKALCKAHPILRTVFITGLSSEGAFQQIVLKHTEPLVSIEQVPAGCSDIGDLFSRQSRPPFEQAKPPHRMSLYTGLGSVVYAILEISHTAIDARTMRVIWEQIGQEYTRPSSISNGRNFSDYVAWLQAQERVVREYWKTYLAAAQPCLLPQDAADTTSNYMTKGPKVPFMNARKLLTFCQECGITVANFMQAAWGAVLRTFTELPSVYFGCLRSDEDGLDGASGILGPLVTMLICKFNLGDGDVTPSQLLEAARNDSIKWMQHSGCSLAQLHDDLGLLESPLFDTIMTIQHAWPSNLALTGGDLVVKAIDGEDPTEYSISVNVHYSKDELRIQLSYQRAKLSDSLIENIADSFAAVIVRMIESPGQALLPSLKREIAAREALSKEESKAIDSTDILLLSTWNERNPEAVEECFPHRVRDICSQRPLAPAVCSWDRNLSYSQLESLSDYLAYEIVTSYGIGAETIVPFFCEKAASAIVVILGILKAGAAFLPMDITHSPDRLAAVLDDAGASLVLVNSTALRERMSACTSQRVVLVDIDALIDEGRKRKSDEIRVKLDSIALTPSNAAYVVYTSGSTGKPKGILVEHRSIATSAAEHAGRIGITPDSRLLQLANFPFDLSVGDIMYALYWGACLCMPSEKERVDDIAGAINRLKANFLWATPTHAALLANEDVPTLKTMSLIGEPLRQENIETWAPRLRLTNSYGPAEAVVMVSCRDVTVGDNSQDIGYPSCCRFWVVDPDNHDILVPIGTTGELVIEGPVVARGYINNPKATAAAFIDPPAWTKNLEFASLNLSTQKFYKTGDLATQASENSFICGGRKDTQIKINGLRIELGEIEYHLNHDADPGWHWVVEVIQPSTSKDVCLAAFFEIKDPDLEEVRDSRRNAQSDYELLPPLTVKATAAKDMLKRLVPAYMVPDYFIHLRKLPTTSSMKTDRRSLRAIAAQFSLEKLLAYGVFENFQPLDQALLTETREEVVDDEVFMQQAWADVLGVQMDALKANDDFFKVGGNSIRAMHLVARLRKAQRILSVADIFKASTLSDMATKTASLLDTDKNSAEDHASSISTQIISSNSIPRITELAERWTWLKSDNIESVAPATDTQAWMLAVGDLAGHGFDDSVSLTPPMDRMLDLSKLQRACQEVLRQHPILRTVFLQHDSQLFQVILRSPPVKQVHIWPGGYSGTQELQNPSGTRILKTLPRFYLSGKDDRCSNLRLKVHHALYDAISLGHVLDDLSTAYGGRAIAAKPSQFHEWAWRTRLEDKTSTQNFWKTLLHRSMSHSLTSGLTSPVSGNPADSKISVSVPFGNLASPHGTAATVLNAAWSLVLSRTLKKQDIVFGYVSANRYSAHTADIEKVAGPCINILPMRASLSAYPSFATLVAGLQQQSSNSIPHHHLGFRSIIKECTEWPMSRFNSLVVFQNHESLSGLVKIGDIDCKFSGEGRVGDSADIWLAAVPQADRLNIDLHYSSLNIPHDQAHRMSASLEAILAGLPGIWAKTASEITNSPDGNKNDDFLFTELGEQDEDLVLVHATGQSHRQTITGDPGHGRERHLCDLVNSVLHTRHYCYLLEDAASG